MRRAAKSQIVDKVRMKLKGDRPASSSLVGRKEGTLSGTSSAAGSHVRPPSGHCRSRCPRPGHAETPRSLCRARRENRRRSLELDPIRGGRLGRGPRLWLSLPSAGPGPAIVFVSGDGIESASPHFSLNAASAAVYEAEDMLPVDWWYKTNGSTTTRKPALRHERQ